MEKFIIAKKGKVEEEFDKVHSNIQDIENRLAEDESDIEELEEKTSDLERNTYRKYQTVGREEVYQKTETYNRTEIDQKIDESVPHDYDTVKSQVSVNASDISDLKIKTEQNISDIRNRYTKTEVDNKIAAATPKDYTAVKQNVDRNTINIATLENKVNKIPKFNVVVVDILPTSSISENTIYLLRDISTEEGNLYTEYIFVDNKWEMLGTQKMDLSDYATKAEVEDISNMIHTEQNYTEGFGLTNRGVLFSNEDLCVTDKIPVKQGMAMTCFHGAYTDAIYFVEFDENDNYLTSHNCQGVMSFISGILNRTAYVRFTFVKGTNAYLNMGDQRVYLAESGGGIVDDIAAQKNDLAQLDAKTVKSVNGVLPDASGNVDISGGTVDQVARDGVSRLSESIDETSYELKRVAGDLFSLVPYADYVTYEKNRWNNTGMLVPTPDGVGQNAYDITVVGGETYYLTGQLIAYNSTYAIRWKDKDGNVTASTDYDTTASKVDWMVEAPKNAVHMLVTAQGGFAFSVKKMMLKESATEYVDRNLDAIDGDSYFADYGWTNGTISSANGGYTGNRADRLCSDFLKGVVSFQCDPTYYGLASFYDSDKKWLNKIISFTKGLKVTRADFPDGCAYVRFALHNNTSRINLEEGKKCSVVFNINGMYSDILEHGERIERVENDFVFMQSASTFSFGSKNQISRLGWLPYDMSNPPEQSIESYTNAYKNGIRIMLCDLQVTSDGEYVCWHDTDLGATLNTNTVRHKDGSVLASSERAQKIAELTLNQLNAYDYGIYKGSKYAGMKIPMIEDFFKWCTLANCIPMIETKCQLTVEQVKDVAVMLKKYDLAERVIIADDVLYLSITKDKWKTELPKATMCVRGGSRAYTASSNFAKEFANDGFYTMLSFTDTSFLTDERIADLSEHNVKFEFSEILSEDMLETFYDDGWLSVFSFIASSYVDINGWIKKKLGL